VTGFLIGVASSVAASVVVVAAGRFVSGPRRLTLYLLSRLTGIGVIGQYVAQRSASADLASDLATARWVKVLAGRGSELTRETFEPMWKQASTLELVQILLPHPDTGEAGSWLAMREAEVMRHDKAFAGGFLAEQVRTNLLYLDKLAEQHESVQVRMYDAPHLCRLVILDKKIYFTLYGNRSHGRDSPCIVVANPSLLYDHLLRLFDLFWSHGEKYSRP
jgi:hypothetical protein